MKSITSFEQLLLRFRERDERRRRRRAYHAQWYREHIEQRRADARAVKRRRVVRQLIEEIRQA